MDFNVRNFAVFDIGGFEVWLTETVVNTWIIMALLIVAAIIVRVRLSGFGDVPKGLQNVVEFMVETFSGFVKNTAGEKLQYLCGWFFSAFAFIFIASISGVFALRPPTADWATTFAFALATFILIQILGLRYQRLGYLKGFLAPDFKLNLPNVLASLLFTPLNIIGELARPVSLSFRLFGNILAGMILMNMLYALTPVYVQLFVPVPLHAYFDIAMAFLQTYIFIVLSLSFVGTASEVSAE